MRRLFGILVGICLCLCAAFCAAEDEWTPPEGKTKGAGHYIREQLENWYFYETEDRLIDWLELRPEGTEFGGELSEKTLRGSITMLSGDEACGDMLSWMDDEEGGWLYLRTGKTIEGSPELHARYRLEAESEHYYVMFEFDATFLPRSALTVTLGFDTVTVPVGTWDEIRTWVDPEEIHVNPAGAWNSCQIRTEEGEFDTETDGYLLSSPYLRVKEPGKYPMTLIVTAGLNECRTEFPVTVTGVDAGGPDTETETAEEIRVGAKEEEVPGEGDGSGGDSLKLALNRGDQEFNVYTGSRDVHLSFWDIENYAKLEKAWGGTPGWSVMPEKGSPDLIRWSNASLDGKSVWAFYGELGEGVGLGDYTSVLTCTWHGQSASAKITIHVTDAPNGPLEGVSGVEESYTMTIGDTIEMDVRPLPEGWTLPGEKAEVSLRNFRSMLEDYRLGESNGLPFFSITNRENEPVRLKALRSGEYTVDVYYECGTFREEVPVAIHVLNADGTLPQTAEEITEAEGSVFTYDLETSTATGETYAVITGGKKTKNLTVPDSIDGYPVRVIGRNAFSGYSSRDGEETIETLEIAEGVRVIDSGAFTHCADLKSVKLPDSLLLIEYGVFSDCRNLSEIRLPSGFGLTQIGNRAFAGIAAEDVVLADGTSLLAESLKGGSDWFSVYADGWEYRKLEDGTALITGLAANDWDTAEITVPETLNGLPVSTLDSGLFMSRESLLKVTLPESLRVIGENAFRGCTSLEEVNLPEGLLEIGEFAFANVAAEGLTLPESARENSSPLWYAGRLHSDASGTYEYGLLEDGTALVTRYPLGAKKLEIPGELDGIPVSATTGALRTGEQDWDAARAMTEVVLPEGLKVIGPDSFSSFTGLKKVRIPGSVTVIGKEAFQSCSGLTDIKLPESLRKIGDKAFAYVPLTKLTLPESLVSIGNDAFTGHSLKEVELPAGVETAGNRAFSPHDSDTLKKVIFHNPLTETGKGLFGYRRNSGYDNTDPVQSELMGYGFYMNYAEGPESWDDLYADPGYTTPEILTVACYPGSTADQKYQYNVQKEYLKWGEQYTRTAPADRVLQAGLYGEDELIYELTVPEGVEEIAEGAFAGMRTLSKVTLPSTLKVLSPRAFEGCTALKEISLPDGISVLGEAAFRDCAMLEKASLPAAAAEIPDSLFENCAALTEVKTKAKEITAVGNRAFRECEKLAKFDLKKGLLSIGEEAFYRTALKKAQIPDTVTSIGKGAFALSGIESISLPKGLEEIPENLCFGAASLKDIKLPASVKKIGDGAFAYCVPAALNLPEGLVSIGEKAFMFDAKYAQYVYLQTNGKKTGASLKTLKLPASLETIGAYAFSSNDALTSVTFAKGSALTEIGDSAFAVCIRLKEIRLPDSVQAVGANAFTNCIEMKKADLGAGVIRIGDEAFLYDEAMTSLTVPDTATELGEKILEGCGSGLTVHCGEGSAMETYVKENAPEITTAR